MQKHQSFAKFQQKCNQFVYHGLIATQKLGSRCYVTKIKTTCIYATKTLRNPDVYNLYTAQKILYFNSLSTRLAHYIIN